jgi:multidrug efflux pump subunit AcrA (membrane-fusion protein)
MLYINKYILNIQKIMIIIISAICLLWSPSPLLAQKKENGPVPVGVAKARDIATHSSFEYPGTVQAWATTQLASEVDGRVDKLLFQEGQYVQKGTPLVKIRIEPLIIQRDLAKAEKNLVEARLEELNTGTRPETIEAAKSAVEQSKARVRLADNELKRIKRLYKDGVLSLDEFDKADAQAQSARAELEERQSMLNELVAGPRSFGKNEAGGSQHQGRRGPHPDDSGQYQSGNDTGSIQRIHRQKRNRGRPMAGTG